MITIRQLANRAYELGEKSLEQKNNRKALELFLTAWAFTRHLDDREFSVKCNKYLAYFFDLGNFSAEQQLEMYKKAVEITGIFIQKNPKLRFEAPNKIHYSLN